MIYQFLTRASALTFAILFASLPLSTFASPAPTSNSSTNTKNALRSHQTNPDYYIDRYHIDINLDKNKLYHITETITVNFKNPRHGIIRTIPTKNRIFGHFDPKSSSPANFIEYAKVSNLNINHPYTISNNSKTNTTAIKIGDKDKTITGEVTYKVSYDYQTFANNQKYSDQLYYNIIGDSWDTHINHTSFNITLPKAFNHNDIGFSVGTRGSYGYDKSSLFYTIKDTTISGEYLGPLPAKNALTIRLPLEKNYFSKHEIFNNSIFAAISISTTCTIICILIYYFYGRNRHPIIETVEFYPPKHLTTLEISTAYNKFSSSNHTIALLFSLANQGYIKIIETEKSKKKSPDFKFIKIKEYTGDNLEEKTFFDGFFKRSKTNSSGETFTTLSLLKNNFYKTASTLISNANKKSVRAQFFDIKRNSKIRLLLSLPILIQSILPFAILMPFISSYTIDFITAQLLLSIPSYILIGLTIGYKKRHEKVSLLIASIILALLTFSSFAVTITNFIDLDTASFNDLIMPISINLLPLISAASFAMVNHYTKNGAAAIGKIRGFRSFLIAAEKPQLEALIEKDPSYFYRILPYAYILGVSKTWIKNFENITVPESEYYHSNIHAHNSSAAFVNNLFSSNLKAINNTMTSSPTSSGSGSSGGGFSGGGSGGGGGSSW